MENKSILITGGTGSLGQEFTRRLLSFEPKVIRILSNDESQIVQMQESFKDQRLRFLLGDVRDKNRMVAAAKGIEIVVHMAAIKHVPVCEYNPGEAVETNILGSINVAEAAIECGADKVLGISSDKAVHPTSIYGATKLCMEKYFTSLDPTYATKFSCVRFGNFWLSRGNVVEKWMRQKMAGQEIELTEKEMSRFYISTDEAVEFSLMCIERMKGGEIFIPLMPSYTLEELASNIAPECKIKVIGRRKGEKKKELLYSEDEERFVERQKDCLMIRNT